MVDILLISLENNTNSIGVRSISGYLRKSDHRPALLFLPELSGTNEEVSEILSFIKAFNPGLVGLSFMTFNLDNAIKLTRAIHIDTKVPVIWGGTHATGAPVESLEYADMVCISDGEVAVSDLLTNIKSGITHFCKDVKNIWFKNGPEEVIRNPIDIPHENYDFLPFLDYSLEDNYILSKKKVLSLSPELFLEHLLEFKIGSVVGPAYMIPVNRGCIFKCSFCANSKYSELYGSYNRLRGFSVERIINELEYVKNNLPMFKSVFIYDMDMLFNPIDWIKKFSNAYSKKIDLPFGTYISINNFSYDKTRLLMTAGMVYCEAGIQSLSKRINSKIFNRHFDLNKLLEIIKRRKDLSGLFIDFDLLVDNPYMTFFDRFESFVAAIRIAKAVAQYKSNHRFGLIKLKFHPGTKLIEMARRDGHLKGDHDTSTPMYYTIQKHIILLPLYYFPFVPENLIEFIINKAKIPIVLLRRVSASLFNLTNKLLAI